MSDTPPALPLPELEQELQRTVPYAAALAQMAPRLQEARERLDAAVKLRKDTAPAILDLRCDRPPSSPEGWAEFCQRWAAGLLGVCEVFRAAPDAWRWVRLCEGTTHVGRCAVRLAREALEGASAGHIAGQLESTLRLNPQLTARLLDCICSALFFLSEAGELHALRKVRRRERLSDRLEGKASGRAVRILEAIPPGVLPRPDRPGGPLLIGPDGAAGTPEAFLVAPTYLLDTEQPQGRDRTKAPPGLGSALRPTFEEVTCTVRFRGQTYKVDNPKAFVVYRAIVDGCPLPLTRADLQLQVKGCKGSHAVLDALNTLPPPLRQTVLSDHNGYRFDAEAQQKRRSAPPRRKKGHT